MYLKNKIFLLFLCLFYFHSKAQKSTVNQNGYNKFYYDNGKLSSEGTMRDGKPDAYWKNYYENGKLKIEGNRKNFMLDSVWKFYDQKGRLTRSINYKEGKKNGQTLIYDTAQKVTSLETYENDVKHGPLKTFYKGGKTKTWVNYNKGKPEGTGYEYSIDSLITAISVYQAGILVSYERVNQRDDNDKKQGIWKEFHENMEVKKEMKFNDDSLDGYVKEYDIKGNLLSTKKYSNGKRILKAPEIAQVEVYREVYQDGTLKYEGVYSDGVAIGVHYKYKQKWQCDSSLFLKDDTARIPVYENRLVCRNVPVPDSCIEYFDGIIVARGAVDSVRNRIGLWYEFHHTGEFKGKGIYRAGNRTGEWEFYYASGKLEQKGKYDKKGKVQGVWKWYYESGAIMREENYVNGKREGMLTDKDEKGNIILQGNFIDNKMEGPWVYETPDYRETGNYVNDERDSVWKSWYMPSKIRRYEGKFVNGQCEGVHTQYYPDGKKMFTGNYLGGMKDGDWKYFDETGMNYLTITFKNDIEVKWMGVKIRPTYEESLRSYNIKIDENKSQTIRK